MSIQLYDKKSLNVGKVLSLRFREGTGTLVFDESTIHNKGTFAAGGNSPTWTQLASGKWVTTFVLASAQYFTIPNNAALFPTAAITMKAWVKPTVVNATQIINGRSGGAATRTGELIIQNDGKAGFWSEDTAKVAYSASAMTAGAWQCIHGVFNGSNMLCYLQGVVGPTGSALAALSTTVRDLQIGKWAGSNPYGGDIGMFEIWNRALSPAEILADIALDAGDFGL